MTLRASEPDEETLETVTGVITFSVSLLIVACIVIYPQSLSTQLLLEALGINRVIS